MLFHENCLADNSHEISYLIFFRKLGKLSQNLSSAAAVIGVIRVLTLSILMGYSILFEIINPFYIIMKGSQIILYKITSYLLFLPLQIVFMPWYGKSGSHFGLHIHNF